MLGTSVPRRRHPLRGLIPTRGGLSRTRVLFALSSPSSSCRSTQEGPRDLPHPLDPHRTVHTRLFRMLASSDRSRSSSTPGGTAMKPNHLRPSHLRRPCCRRCIPNLRKHSFGRRPSRGVHISRDRRGHGTLVQPSARVGRRRDEQLRTGPSRGCLLHLQLGRVGRRSGPLVGNGSRRPITAATPDLRRTGRSIPPGS